MCVGLGGSRAMGFKKFKNKQKELKEKKKKDMGEKVENVWWFIMRSWCR